MSITILGRDSGQKAGKERGGKTRGGRVKAEGGAGIAVETGGEEGEDGGGDGGGQATGGSCFIRVFIHSFQHAFTQEVFLECRLSAGSLINQTRSLPSWSLQSGR